MQRIIKNLLSVIALLIFPLLTMAQDSVPMAGAMRSNGKIYVVVSVVVLIFIGILFFLIALDKRLRRLEKHST